MKVAEILKNKGNNIYSVLPDTSVFDALKLMGEKNIGALMVMQYDQLIGIFSERDYARKVVLVNRTSRETLISDIMTTAVISVAPNDSIEHCMELMSKKKIRHLPVIIDGEVAGLISISDVVTAIIQSQKETILHLENYIHQ